MTIVRDEIVPLLLEACPSYSKRWTAYSAEPEFEHELIYVHLGDFAHHIVELLQSRTTEEFPAVFGVIERLHLEGDSYVKEAATVGALEALQNVASDPADFEPFLGPESRNWWGRLNDFWEGNAKP